MTDTSQKRRSMEVTLNGKDEDLNAPAKMRKDIGLVNSITIIIGSMIGSGIFVSPTGIVENVRSFGASIVIWIGCGLFSMLGAYCYAELGTMIHRSGGDYAYHLEAFGPFMGFLRLWIEVMVARPATMAVIGMTFAKYILQPIFPDCEQSETVLRCLSAVCLLILAFINSYSVRLSTRVQDFFTYAKVFALLLIIVTGFVQMGLGRVEELKDPFYGSNWNPGDIAKAFYSGLFAYAGWNYLNCMIEEMSNPRRDLPISIIFSCLCVTVVYTLANVAYLTVVSLNEMFTTPAVAVTFANRIYGPMWWIMPLFVAFSTFGGVNGSMLTASRVFFVASRENQMPQLVSFLHVDRLTPIPAVIFTCVVSLAYLLVTDIYALITYLGFVQWFAIGLTVAIVLIFRVTRRDTPRPVRAPIMFAVIYVSVTMFLVIFTFVGAPRESLMGVLIMLTAVPVYIVGCVWKSKPKSFQRMLYKCTIGSQKLMRLVPGG
ncbi:Large neutral amino acids transporter small subunit 2 [Fasciola hepatica]|uniref:Large neutral amino acids transporter small subunit 2 n=1 Tax=Fasciola hepatica TaxID=6192 RepID=A0A4E0RT22_FASHE|nr:Large neutral amino acids transporter small subunit 2 [Fasciola hepatica]